MKTKQLVKRLGLNKETIANLNAIQMKDIYGGATASAVSLCPTNCKTSPCGTCGTCQSCDVTTPEA